MPSFENTSLWRGSLSETAFVGESEARNTLRECLFGMRNRAEHLVSLIPRDVPGFTVHDVTHLDALWETASLIAGDNYPLNPAEAFVFGAAILLHDAAMSLAAYPGGVADIKNTPEWRDAVANRLQQSRGESFDRALIDNPPLEIGKASIADVLRDFHSKHAAELPFLEWPLPNKKREVIIQDSELRNAYGDIIGRIAASHWWPASDLRKLPPRLNAGPGIPASWFINPLKIACLLRVADAAHIDHRRAPRFLHALVKPTDISATHWTFQSKLGKPSIEKNLLVYTGSPFDLEEAEAWWLCYDMIALIDDELRAVNTLLDSQGIQPFIATGVKGAKSPEAISSLILTKSWKPVNTELRVSDVPALVDLLGGERLYGSDLGAAVRELIQNGADAIRAKCLLVNLPQTKGIINIRLRHETDGHWLDIEDDGIGMSPNVLSSALLDFGRSFWSSAGMRKEFPGLQSKGLKTTGRFGIGFFSVFMLGERVIVTTRRFDKALSDTHTLDFRKGLRMRPILREPSKDEVLSQPGTRVSVLLHIPTDKPGGLLYDGEDNNNKDIITPLHVFVSSLCPSIDVTVTVEEDQKKVIAVSANDWLSEQADVIVLRTGKDFDFWEDRYCLPIQTLFRDLKDPTSNEIYGRACIYPKDSYYGHSGVVTVGGLRASDLPRIPGVLKGEAKTVTRNEAIPTVPAAVLREWASEQARLIASSKFRGQDKLSVASFVMFLGGNATDLPIAVMDGEYYNKRKIIKIVHKLASVEVYYHDSVDYDEDADDSVTPKDFRTALCLSEDLFLVPQEYNRFGRGLLRCGDKNWPQCIPELYSAMNPKSCKEAFESILKEVWGAEPECEVCNRVVGSVYGDKIIREVCVYSRYHNMS